MQLVPNNCKPATKHSRAKTVHEVFMAIVPKLDPDDPLHIQETDSLYPYQSFAGHYLPQIDKLLHFNPKIANILTLSFPFCLKY
jgi:hypothetical protein